MPGFCKMIQFICRIRYSQDHMKVWMPLTPRLHQIITEIVIQCKATDFSGFQCFFGQTLIEILSFRE